MQLGKKKIGNVLLFLVKRKDLLSKDNLTVYLNLWGVFLACIFLKKVWFCPSFILFSLYSVDHGFYEGKLYLSPWILEFAFIILYIEKNRSRKEKRKKAQDKEKYFLVTFKVIFFKTCRISHMFKLFYHGTCVENNFKNL